MNRNFQKKALQNAEIENEYLANLNGKNLLGIDFGQKFCGLAVCPARGVILPLKVVQTSNFWDEVLPIIRDKKIQTVVFGLPTSVFGGETPISQKVRQIARQLQKKSPEISVHLQGEHFSSKTAPINFQKNKTQNRNDDLAAARILEYFLQENRLQMTESGNERDER